MAAVRRLGANGSLKLSCMETRPQRGGGGVARFDLKWLAVKGRATAANCAVT